MSRLTRRTLLASLSALPVAAADERRPVVRVSFDRSLRNEGTWGGSVQGAAGMPDGSAEIGTERLYFKDPRLVTIESFTATLCFNPRQFGREMSLLARPNHWEIRISSSGLLTVIARSSATGAQALHVTQLYDLDSWRQLGISFDRSRNNLDFVLRQAADETRRTSGSFRIASGAFRRDADDVLQIGSLNGSAPFAGRIDNLLLFDKSLPRDILDAVLRENLPSPVPELSLEDCLMPSAPDPSVILPRRSDVPMSSRWWRPRKPGDPQDTLRDLKAFQATRLEWIYETDAAHIRAAKEAGYGVCTTINGSDLTQGRVHAARNFDGGLMTFPWMVSWTQSDGLPPGAACVNNPLFRESQAKLIGEAVAAGAVAIQYDDWASNVSVTSVAGECFCRFCLQKFQRRQHADADYRAFLRKQRGVTDLASYLVYRRDHAAEPLQRAYSDLQIESVRENLSSLKNLLAGLSRDGRRPALSVNAHFDSPGRQSKALLADDVPDYFTGEGGDQSLAGMFTNAKLAESLQRTSIYSPFPYQVDRTRAEVALQYALGQLCLVPYDIWMRSSDLPRYFGAPEQYADLFEFVRTNAALFDACESVATVGVLVDTLQPEDSRFRPLIQALASRGIPFHVCRAGPGDAACKHRLRFVVNLTGAPIDRGEFPQAREWSANLRDDQIRTISLLRVEAPDVIATVRASRDGRIRAIHLVNYTFDEFSRSVPIHQFGVQLQHPTFWGLASEVRILSPEGKSVEATLYRFGRGLRVVVPELRTWAVICISRR